MLIYVAQWLGLLAVAALAIAKGRAPERYGATWMILNAALVAASEFVVPRSSKAIAYLILDAVCATGFLVLAIRYLSRWLGIAMLLSALIFAMQAYYMVTERAPDLVFHALNNSVTGVIAVSLLIATVATWRARTTDG